MKDLQKSTLCSNDIEASLPSEQTPSREIPFGISLPSIKNNELCPAVLLVHGFLGHKEENGVYYGDYSKTGIHSISKQLLELGIASIRLDMPGSGASQADFRDYTLQNCLADLNTVYRYCLEHYPIDYNKIGLVGLSMGGKIGAAFINLHPEIRTAVFLNPAGDNGNHSLLTAAEAGLDYPALEKELGDKEEVLNQPISEYFEKDFYMTASFFKQVNASKTGDEITEFLKSGGHGLLLFGGRDSVINPETYTWLIKNTSIPYLCIPEMTHELGVDINDLRITNTVTEVTASHLYRFLKS